MQVALDLYADEANLRTVEVEFAADRLEQLDLACNLLGLDMFRRMGRRTRRARL